MKTIAISRSDGGVSILQIKPKYFIDAEGNAHDLSDAYGHVIAAMAVEQWEEVMNHPTDPALDVKCVSWAEIALNKVPTDRTFRNAWTVVGAGIGHDMGKVRILAHAKRRAVRDVEMKPHDDVIAKQIPGADAKAAEDARKKIRDKYAAVQAAIDAAADVAAVKLALGMTA